MKKVNSKLDFTWVVVSKARFEEFLNMIVNPPILADADPIARAAYSEVAEMHAESIRAAHHVPMLVRSLHTEHLFEHFKVQTQRMGVLEDGYDEFAVSLWSMASRAGQSGPMHDEYE